MTRLEQIRALNEQRFEDPGAIGNAFDDAMGDLLAVAAAAQKALVTICRDCRGAPADFCMWGKLFPENQLGFKCEDCARAQGVQLDRWDIEQSAIIDCRPARAALAPLLEEAEA